MRKRISGLLSLLVLMIAGLLFSAQDTDRALVIQQLMDEAIMEKVENYKSAMAKRCQEKMLEEAGRRADSIVIIMAKSFRILQDTINRPQAPDRPNRPVAIPPLDSTAAAPLLPDSVLIN